MEIATDMKNIDSLSDTSAEHILYNYFTYVDPKRPVSLTSDVSHRLLYSSAELDAKV